MQTNEEVELQKINQQAALDREEQRLNLLEEIHRLAGKFGHWGTREYAEHGDLIRAGAEAFQLLDAAVRHNKSKMKESVNSIVWELGYRIEMKRFKD